MAGQGRRPKPDALKELAGNPGHRPLNDCAPQPLVGVPEMPKGMLPAARREWHAIVPVLLQLGVLTSIDGKSLAAYCDAYAHWEKARKEIEKYGLVVEEPVIDKDGDVRTDVVKLKANPAVNIYNAFAKTMKSFLIEFGLTPASRSRLKVERPKEDDPMEALLVRRTMEQKPVQSPQQVAAAKLRAPLAFDTGAKLSGASIPEGLTNFDS